MDPEDLLAEAARLSEEMRRLDREGQEKRDRYRQVIFELREAGVSDYKIAQVSGRRQSTVNRIAGPRSRKA